MARPVALRSPAVSLPDLPADLSAGPAWSRGMELEAAVWSGGGTANAPYCSVTECRIDGGVYDVLDFSHGTLRDMEVLRVGAASLGLRGARVRRLRITGGRIGTVDLADATVDELVLDGVRVDYLSCARGTLTDVDVIDCTIGTLDAPAAKLTRARFRGSRVDELDLRDAMNSHVDLRGLDVAAHVDVRGLSGATISDLQAQLASRAFAEALGVSVRE